MSAHRPKKKAKRTGDESPEIPWWGRDEPEGPCVGDQLGYALCLVGAERGIREDILEKAVFNSLPSFLHWAITHNEKHKEHANLQLTWWAGMIIHKMILDDYLGVANADDFEKFNHPKFDHALIEEHGLHETTFSKLLAKLRRKY